MCGTEGHLVAEARLGWSNEKGSASPTIPGMGLDEVMGCRETDVKTGQAGRTVLKWTGEATTWIGRRRNVTGAVV